MIRGQETAGHLYVKRSIMEILHELGAIVAEEAIFPNNMQVDVMAVLNEKILFFEVVSYKGSHSKKRKKVLGQKDGKGCVIYYNNKKLPSKDELLRKIRETLER